MMSNGKIGLALVGGYLLGRTKKAKMAIGLGMVLAGKKLDLNPQRLAKLVANSPVIGQLSDQVRKDLVDGTKSALTSAVTQRADSIADSLHERTLDINDPTRSVRGSDGADDEDAVSEDEDGEEREERPKRRSKAPAASGGSDEPAKGAKSARSAKSTAGKTASGSRADGTGNGARKTASSGARKAAGTRKAATKTASGGARKAVNRGGSNG